MTTPHPTPSNELQADGLLQAFRDARKGELFQDGVEADLHSAGIDTIAEAYMAGRQDVLDEIELRATEIAKSPPPQEAPAAPVRAVEMQNEISALSQAVNGAIADSDFLIGILAEICPPDGPILCGCCEGDERECPKDCVFRRGRNAVRLWRSKSVAAPAQGVEAQDLADSLRCYSDGYKLNTEDKVLLHRAADVLDRVSRNPDTRRVAGGEVTDAMVEAAHAAELQHEEDSPNNWDCAT